ncbi:MAG: hypothetical protein JXA14_26310 [Anaerolineae bacterium]|nr:hypothetical protein [Anaerolineae bacterium]
MSGHLEITLASGDLVTATIENVAVLSPCGPQPTNRPPMALYSQNDPRWKNLVYAGGSTFGQAGCYVVAVAMIASLAGSVEDPPRVAEELVRAGCFEGNLLTKPENIPLAYPGLRYDGSYRWHTEAADMSVVWEELARSPIIVEVDFKPGGGFNQHFVVAEAWNEETAGIQIADPWDGRRKELPAAYSPVYGGWSLERAIYGLRLLRVI